MSSLDEANRFVNCVMNRTRNDTLMRGGMMLLLVAIPLLALLFGFLYMGFENKNDPEIENFLASVVIVFFFYSLMLLIYFVYRRSVDHDVRDDEWRDSLIDYAAQCGCDTKALIAANIEARRKQRTIAEKPALFLILLLFILIMIFGAFPKVFNISTNSADNLIWVIAAAAVESIAMFFFVMLYLIKTPYMHESSQIKFVDAFSDSMAAIGVSVPKMQGSVKNVNVVLSIILFVITGGLFIFYMLYKTFANTNYHIMNQWDYELRLMNIIVTNEGGMGILPDNATQESISAETKKVIYAIPILIAFVLIAVVAILVIGKDTIIDILTPKSDTQKSILYTAITIVGAVFLYISLRHTKVLKVKRK